MAAQVYTQHGKGMANIEEKLKSSEFERQKEKKRHLKTGRDLQHSHDKEVQWEKYRHYLEERAQSKEIVSLQGQVEYIQLKSEQDVSKREEDTRHLMQKMK